MDPFTFPPIAAVLDFAYSAVAALADLLGAVVVGLARMTATSNDTDRLGGAVEVLGRFLDGSLLARPSA